MRAFLKITKNQAIPAGIAGAYLLLASLYALWKIPSGLGNTQMDYYPQYAQALLAGKFWLTPMDALQNCPHDLSGYDGHCYVYWGIIPALLHVIFPFLSDRLVALFASTIAIYFLNRLLLDLARACSDEKISLLKNALPFCLALSLVSGFGVLGLVGRVYEESLAVATALGLIGLTLARPYLWGDKVNFASLKLLGSVLAFCAAGLTRIPWFLCGMMTGIFLLVSHSQRTPPPLRMAQLKRLLGLGVVFLAAISIQLLINFLRFGNLMETGYSLQTTQVNMAPWLESHPGVFSLRYLPYNAIIYWITGFKEFFLEEGILLQKLMKHCYYREFPAGLLVWMPSLLLFFFVSRKSLPRKQLFTMSVSLLPLAVPALLLSFQIFRYQWEAFAFGAVPISAILIARNPHPILAWGLLWWTGWISLTQWNEILTLLKDTL